MTEEIKYQGVTANPSDYDCQDGTLALSLNLWPENGSLKPVLPPEKLLTSPYEIVCVHKTSAFTHYIALSANSESDYDLYFHDGNTDTATSIGNISSKVREVTSIGNTLVVLTDGGMEYYLWKDSAYKYLGNHFPEIGLSFGLQGKVVMSDEFEVDYTLADSSRGPFGEFDEDTISKTTSQVLAKVNKFIAEESVEKGRFIMPFFVRYAYRLFDGSLTMHSAPILMLSNTGTAPAVVGLCTRTTSGTSSSYTTPSLYRVAGVTHQLDYAVIDNPSGLDDWQDIVKSVDIFVSAPIYKYDQSGECEKLANLSPTGECVCLDQDASSVSDTSYSTGYVNRTISEMFFAHYPSTTSGQNTTGYFASIPLPEKSSDTVDTEIRSNHAFYLLKALKLSELTSTRTIIKVAEDYLQSLVNREVMTDDYDSHDNLIPSISFGYNSRLNISGLSKELFGGYYHSSQVCYCGVSGGYITYYIHIRQDGKEIVVKKTAAGRSTYIKNLPLLWIYFPNTNAFKVTVAVTEYRNVSTGSSSSTYKNVTTYYEYPLETHDFLNGSFYFSGSVAYSERITEHWYDEDNGTTTTPSDITVSSVAERTISIPNKIYTSEVNNPFLYLVTNINTVGTGEIIGISTAAKALSQGQFGEFPLYAFSTDGIWALTVSSTGGYSAKQPVSRDVCIDADSITQTDNSVIYATERGLMMIAGSETACLSDVIDDKDGLAVGLFEEFTEAYNLFEPSFSDIYFGDLGGNFRLFLDGLKVIYDDTSRRLILFSTGNDSGAAYVYSMNEKAWGMMSTNGLVRAVPSWPEALAQNANGDLFDFSKRRSNGVGIDADDMHHYSETAQLILTRPFKLKLPDVHKTIDTIIQRGNFHKKNVQQVLYGSNDLEHWIPVYSSDDKYLRGFHGTPYKYYVLAMKCVLADGESLSGMTVQYTPKLTNQPR